MLDMRKAPAADVIKRFERKIKRTRAKGIVQQLVRRIPEILPDVIDHFGKKPLRSYSFRILMWDDVLLRATVKTIEICNQRH